MTAALPPGYEAGRGSLTPGWFGGLRALVWRLVFEPFNQALCCGWPHWLEGVRYEPPPEDPGVEKSRRRIVSRVAELERVAGSLGAELVVLSRHGVFSGATVAQLHRERDAALDELVRLTRAQLVGFGGRAG